MCVCVCVCVCVRACVVCVCGACVCVCRVNMPRKQGGLGPMNIPLVADSRRTIATDYGVLKEDDGCAFR